MTLISMGQPINTVDYAAWHMPCYRGHNCHKRFQEEVISEAVTTRSFDVSDGVVGGVSGDPIVELGGLEFTDGIVILFLFLIVATAFVGDVVLCGSLCSQGGGRRPFNQLLISLLVSDLCMVLLVIPLHVAEVFSPQDKLGSPSACQAGLFGHLTVVSVRSWSLAAFILLHHLHDGLVPTTHSIMVIVWTWIASALLVLPTVLSDQTLVDFQQCSLTPTNYGMIIYVCVVLYMFPNWMLTPLFIKWSNLKQQFAIRKDISCDFLNESEDEEKEPLPPSPQQQHSLDSEIQSITLGRKASRATMAFLKSDPNLPRTLFVLSGVNIVAWSPLFIMVLLAPVLKEPPSSEWTLIVAWLGFGQSALTPPLIYFLSDRVFNFVNKKVFRCIQKSVNKKRNNTTCAPTRRRTRTITFTEQAQNV